jgi:hypothetical protein
MALQLIKIDSVEVSSPVASITFSNIPQGYTDLKIVYSARVSASGIAPDGLGIQFNGDTASNYRYLQLYGVGNSANTNSGTAAFQFGGQLTGSSATASTFGNGEFNIPNYTSSNYKASSSDNATENNAVGANLNFISNLWQSTAAITSIKLYDLGSTIFVTNSTFTLYGVL